MTRNVRRLFLYVSIVALTFGAATVMLTVRAARLTKIVKGNATLPMDRDGAFCDGLYLGKLDAESGRKPHLSIGRWNTTRDRASFVAGYQQGYRQVHDVNTGE